VYEVIKILKYVSPSWGNSTTYSKHLISLANREPQNGKDENRNHFCFQPTVDILPRGGASRGQRERINVEATKTSGGGGRQSVIKSL